MKFWEMFAQARHGKVTLRETAKKLGVSCLMVSGLEHGRLVPDAILSERIIVEFGLDREIFLKSVAEDEALIRENIRKDAARTQMFVEARRRIVEDSDQYKRRSGCVECPICHGRLKYKRSEYNGHIHAYCLDKKCFNWME